MYIKFTYKLNNIVCYLHIVEKSNRKQNDKNNGGKTQNNLLIALK